MPGLDNPILNFDRGIERVMTGQAVPVRVQSLPQSLPWSGEVQERIEQLLREPSRDEQLLGALAPEGLSPSLLSPSKFRPILRSSAKRIRERAGDHDSFARAATVLDDVESAEDLLEAFRNALRQA